MKNKKSYIFIVILILLVIVSVVFTIVKNNKKKTKINTKVDIVVDFSDSIEEYDNTNEMEDIEDNNEYTEPRENRYLSSNLDYYETDTIENNTENNTENITTITSDIDETDFLNTFSDLLLTDLSNVDYNSIPITENFINSVGSFISEDAYTNGFIVLKSGINIDNNTFMFLIRTINGRIYITGTLVDNKIDTVNVRNLY